MNPLRVLLLLVAGLVLLARGLQLYDERLSALSRPRYPSEAEIAAQVAADAETGSQSAGTASGAGPTQATAAVPQLPPATESQVRALLDGDAPRLSAALRSLRGHTITPDVALALDAAQARAAAPDLQRLIACHRGRQEGAPLEAVFAALPDAPSGDDVWRQEGTDCLVQVIAMRAGENPARAMPVLVDRVLESAGPAVLLALASLDPPELPARIADAVDDRSRPRTRRAAVGAALAMGAGAKWPQHVKAWLEDPDREVRLQTLRTLAAAPDEASLALAAEALAWEPGDEAVASVAAASLAMGGGLDHALAAVAADPAQPPFARGHAAFLVSEAGREAACRTVATVRSGDATLTPELRAATARIAARFPPTPGGGRP